MVDKDDDEKEQLEFVSSKEFTAEERERLRRMLLSQERAAWFWTTLGIWLKWFAATAAAVAAMKILLGDSKELIRSWLALK